MCIIVKKLLSSPHKTTLSLLSSFTLFLTSSIATSLERIKEPESTGQGIEKQTTLRVVTSGFPCKNCFWKRVVSQNIGKNLATLFAAWILSNAQERAAYETIAPHSVIWQMSKFCVFKCPVVLALEIVGILPKARALLLKRVLSVPITSSWVLPATKVLNNTILILISRLTEIFKNIQVLIRFPGDFWRSVSFNFSLAKFEKPPIT